MIHNAQLIKQGAEAVTCAFQDQPFPFEKGGTTKTLSVQFEWQKMRKKPGLTTFLCLLLVVYATYSSNE
jgi:hypothetical protein